MNSDMTAIVAAVLALLGAVYTAWQSRAAAHHTVETTAEVEQQQVEVDQRQLDQAAFQAIQDSLQRQIDRMREEMGELKSRVEELDGVVKAREQTIRVAMAHVRELNRVITAHGITPVDPPTELIAWSI